MAKKKITKKTVSPFKDVSIFEKEIADFANRFKVVVSNHAKRISDYFEMSCYNLIVGFYEKNGYTISVQNLQDNKYRYKCSPAGVQSNFSYFQVTKKIGKKTYEFEIQHNLATQSSFDSEVFTNPDITVIKKGTAEVTTEYYDINRRFSYVSNENLITFFEVKNFNPFPELVFNFIGVINELQKEIMTNKGKIKKPIHLAPSLMVSGKPNKQTLRIKVSLENRYCINIIYDLFNSSTTIFSKARLSQLKTTGKLTTIKK